MVDRLAALQQGDLRLGAGGLKLGQGLFRLSLLDALSVENADKLASALLALLGQLYYQGLMNNDFELALAIQMFYVLIALVGQLITDLSYGIVDPRVRVNK